MRILVAAVGWEEELLPPPLSLLGEGEGKVEERRGQSSRFNGPGMDGKLKAAQEVSWMDGKLVSAMGVELGTALGASRMDGRLGFVMSQLCHWTKAGSRP